MNEMNAFVTEEELEISHAFGNFIISKFGPFSYDNEPSQLIEYHYDSDNEVFFYRTIPGDNYSSAISLSQWYYYYWWFEKKYNTDIPVGLGDCNPATDADIEDEGELITEENDSTFDYEEEKEFEEPLTADASSDFILVERTDAVRDGDDLGLTQLFEKLVI